jgi:hypothetical protein
MVSALGAGAGGRHPLAPKTKSLADGPSRPLIAATRTIRPINVDVGVDFVLFGPYYCFEDF